MAAPLEFISSVESMEEFVKREPGELFSDPKLCPVFGVVQVKS